MYQGNWKCSQCGGPITELPFQPRSESGLTCRSCFMKNRSGGGGGEDQGGGSAAAPVDPVLAAAGDFDDREAPPFDPDEAGVASEPAPPADIEGAEAMAPGERKAFTGDWQCSGCGAPITSLPFEPRSTNNLKCLDCFKRSKA